MQPTTVMLILEELVTGLREQGFVKQVLTTGHGGSYWKSSFIKNINSRYKDIVVIDAHFEAGPVWAEALQRAGLEDHGEIHGGAVSRALALYLAPECVQEGEFGTDVPDQLRAYTDYGVWAAIAPDGSWGRFRSEDTETATSEAGRTLLEYFVAQQSERLKQQLFQACQLKGVPN